MVKYMKWLKEEDKNALIALLIVSLILAFYLFSAPSSKSSIPEPPPCEPDYMGGCW